MKRGEISFVMWFVFGLIVLLAVILAVLSLKGQSLSIVDIIVGAFE